MVSIPQTTESAPGPNAENSANTPLEILFLQDTTGSQGPYITAARKAIHDICNKISSTGELTKELIRFGLIAFRDHPPQESTYVTKNFGFTSDINKMYSNLSSLVASGGGDGPEAQTAALADALNMEWSRKAIKIVILITDSPPHGLGEVGDGFQESPDQNDPLEIVRQMAERGITLFVVACEPTLSQSYKNALDFYTALTQITSGRVFPLLMADRLGDYIVGTAIETLDTERLIGEFEEVIVEDVYAKSIPIEQVAENLQQFMNQKGRKINTIDVEDVYISDEAANANRKLWFGAGSLVEARSEIKPVSVPRIQSQYLSSRSTSIFGSSPMAFGSPPAPASPLSGMFGGLGSMSPSGGVAFGAASPSGGASFGSAWSPPPPSARPYASVAPSLFSSYDSVPPQVQQVSLASQDVSFSQASRVVTQSIARNSKVTAAGMISKATGQFASVTTPDITK